MHTAWLSVAQKRRNSVLKYKYIFHHNCPGIFAIEGIKYCKKSPISMVCCNCDSILNIYTDVIVHICELELMWIMNVKTKTKTETEIKII